MFVVVVPHIFSKRFNGMAIYPFIFIKDKKLKANKTMLNHERIHLRQQLELLWIFFFIWYVIEFLIHYIRYRDWMKAYYSISFEKEAYTHEVDPHYLKTRKFWGFLKFL